jgi:16S rRNA (uracil1498-N3)-methyltransferase
VDAPQPLLNYLGAMNPKETPGLLRLVLEPEGAARDPRGARVVDMHAAGPVAGADIAIGPEGGFAPEELEAFELSAFSRLRLGPRVLRTETAAIAAIVVLQARFGDMSAVSDDSSRTEDP